MIKIFIRNFIVFASITTSSTYASSTNNIDSSKMKTYENLCYTSDCISTQQLQKEVEKLSIEGKLPFEMGLELIRRWSDNKIS